MKVEGFQYEVAARLSIYRPEVKYLMTLAEAHYDSVCKQAAQMGGFLYGWWNRFEALDSGERVEVFLTWRDADMLCKILESEGLFRAGENLHLASDYKALLRWMRTQHEVVNNTTYKEGMFEKETR